ncbi:MAG: AMMECR1 domain-containing protein [Patescibacteria group bacterium]
MNTLTPTAVDWLLQQSRFSIEYFLETKNLFPFEKVTIPEQIKEEVLALSGAFILIESYFGNKRIAYIRGENGVFERVEPLAKIVHQVAVNAAFFDPHTPRLKNFELNEMVLHLLVPSEKQIVSNGRMGLPTELAENSTGLILETRGRIAYDLPQMISEALSVEQRVRKLLLRLGVKGQKAVDSVDFYTFTVQHHSEVKRE